MENKPRKQAKKCNECGKFLSRSEAINETNRDKDKKLCKVCIAKGKKVNG